MANLAQLFKNTPKLMALFRKDSQLERLIQEGFQEGRQLVSRGTYGELQGLDYSRNKRDLAELIAGRRTQVQREPNIEAYPLPGSKIKNFSPEEWEQQVGRDSLDLTKDFKQKYDFVTHPDLNSWRPDLLQTTQLNPGKAIAKIKSPQGDIYKILGAAGVGALSAGVPSDSEAFPVGKALKGSWKEFSSAMKHSGPLGETMAKLGQKEPAVSSASQQLKGMPFRDSKISGVYQGPGTTRYLHLEDGRIFPTDTRSIHELAAESGTQQYIKKFSEQPSQQAQVQQALKSLVMNEQKVPVQGIGGAKPYRQQVIENSLQDRRGMTQQELAQQVLVQSEKTKGWFIMPKVYVDILEPMGLIKADRKWNPLGKGQK